MSIAKIKNKISQPFIFSLLLNVATLIVSAFVYKPFFEENDDAFLSMIAEGAYGAKENHLIYTNIILGSIYKGLYSVCHSIRWHSVLQYLFLFVAFTTLIYILQKFSRGKITSVIVMLTVFYEVYVSVQYSKTAAIVSVIGFIALYEAVRRGYDKKLLAVGYVLLLYGMLLRDSSFCLAILFMIVPGIYEVLNREEKNFIRKLIPYIKVLVPAAVVFVLTFAVNKAAYLSNDEWNRFMKYNDTRMELQDFRYDLLDYVKYGDRLTEMGISENDAMLYLTWQFGDDVTLNEDAMREVLDAGQPRHIGIEMFKNFAENIYEDVFRINMTIIGLIMITAAAYVLIISGLKEKDNKIALVTITCEIIIFAGVMGYYQYSGRWSHRIVYAAALILPIVFSYVIADYYDEYFGKSSEEIIFANKSGLKVYETVAIVLLTFACVGMFLGNRFEYNEAKRSDVRYRSFLESISDNKNVLYIADTFTFQRAYRYDVFHTYEEGSLENFAAVGSWFVNSPVTKNITHSFGYENPFTALADATDKVILVDNMYAEAKLEYINEHYNNTYCLKTIGEQDGFTLYSVVSE